MRTIISGAGTALLGIGYAGGGNRATEAAQAAIASPLLETPIDGARGILLGVTGGPDLSLVEVSEAARVVADAADPEANIIFGATIDPELSGQVWVTVVAANFSGVRAGPPAGAAAESRRRRRAPSGRPSRAGPSASRASTFPTRPPRARAGRWRRRGAGGRGGGAGGGSRIFDVETEPPPEFDPSRPGSSAGPPTASTSRRTRRSEPRARRARRAWSRPATA